MPGPSLIHTAAADHSRSTSAVSPSTWCVSGVSDSSPFTEYCISEPASSSPMISRAWPSWGAKSSPVNGISVGDRSASAREGISSGRNRIGRWAYEPTSIASWLWRSYMNTSMSRTIG